MSIVGTRVVRKEDPKFLTVGGTYTADVRDALLSGAAHAVFVRSTMAHATLVSVDTTDAKMAPGVLGVYAYDDIADLPGRDMPPGFVMLPPALGRPILATGKVRFVGEPIVVIVAETAAQATDAGELVVIDYEPLPVIVDPEKSAASDVLICEPNGSNVAMALQFGSDPTLFDGCEVVISQRVVHNRVAAAPLEGRSSAAVWSNDRLIHWCSTQTPQGARDALQGIYGLPEGAVRVIAPDVGGGFGPKIGIYAEELLLGYLAKKVNRAVRWTETRSENMTGLAHGRAQIHYATMGGTRDGQIQAYRIDVLQDAGAYGMIGAFLPFMTRTMASAVYAIPKVECNATSVLTNTTPVAAYRGAGRPEATLTAERMMDLYAAEIGMDSVALRRKNLISADAFPYTTAVGTTYDVGDYEKSLDMAMEAANYTKLRADQAARRASGSTKQLGIGVAVYVEVTAGPTPGEEWGKVEILADGSAKVYTGTSPHGQGHVTSWSMIAADELGIPFDKITVVHGDTDEVPKGVGTFGSRSLQLGGAAVQKASRSVVALAREVAATLLEANVDDVVLDTDRGAFHVSGTPAVSRSWAEVATEAADTGGLAAAEDFASTPTFPFGAHIAVVEVDTETGEVRLDRMITCDDSGTLINPLLVEGQRHGGIAQGVGQALLEEIRYDDDGNPVTSNFADYGIISMAELPSYELATLETPTPLNPLGAKGIGESGAIGSTPAVQSAVVDALAHLGVKHIDIPLTAEKVWRAISVATA
jgi:aerobic carbon-monoxide dehydrogenase large subunit